MLYILNINFTDIQRAKIYDVVGNFLNNDSANAQSYITIHELEKT